MNYDASVAVEVARVDDWIIDVDLTEKDGTTGTTAPLTTGTVTAHLSVWPPSLTPLPSSQATLSHLGNGRWLGGRDTTQVTAALAGIRDGGRIALVYVVDGAMARFREGVVVTMRRV